MKAKAVLRFYFSAEKLEGAIDNLILKTALSSEESFNGEKCAEKIISLICAKQKLANLYGFLDGVLCGFDKEEIAVLRSYSLMRCGISKLTDERIKLIRKLTVRFSRRAKNGIARHADGLKLIAHYYCLL